MKKRLSILLLLLSIVYAISWGVDQRLIAVPNRVGSNHYAYPYPNAELPMLTPAPNGYKPCFISHYGRHGSRWLTHDYSYSRPVATLKKAHEAQALNEQGERLLEKLQYIEMCSRSRVGDLSDIGAEQHKGITQRMCRNFPEIFGDKNTSVKANSTIVIRCILSMLNATGEIAVFNPNARITTDASHYDMHSLGWGEGEDTLANHIRKELVPFADSIYRNTLKPQGFLKRIFKDLEFAATIDGQQLMSDVFDLAGSLQNHHAFDDISLYSLFSNEELEQMWKLKNMYWYMNWANSPQAGNRTPLTRRDLLNDIVGSIDNAIKNNSVGAALRYGHETCLLPLACLMQLDDVGYVSDDLNTLHEHWRDYEYIPMAANIQVVVYRNNDKSADGCLIKVLYNEHEARLPLNTDNFPYYKWNDVRNLWLDRTSTVIDWSKPAIANMKFSN